MQQSKRFRIGNIIMYNDDAHNPENDGVIGKIYSITQHPDKPDSIFDILLQTFDGKLFYAHQGNIKNANVSEQILERFGFEEKIDHHPHRLLFDDNGDEYFSIDVYRSRFNEKNWVVCIDKEYVGINTVHELQNLIYTICEKDLEYPFSK
jgi:hypothetical protein